MTKLVGSSLRFVRSLEQQLIDFIRDLIIGYIGGKILDFAIKRSWPALRQFALRITWFFPVGVGALALQALISLGYLPPSPSLGMPILDQAVSVLVVEMGLLLTGLGLSMGGSRRSFRGVQIVGSKGRRR
jgi:hypothetical protein